MYVAQLPAGLLKDYTTSCMIPNPFLVATFWQSDIYLQATGASARKVKNKITKEPIDIMPNATERSLQKYLPLPHLGQPHRILLDCASVVLSLSHLLCQWHLHLEESQLWRCIETEGHCIFQLLRDLYLRRNVLNGIKGKPNVSFARSSFAHLKQREVSQVTHLCRNEPLLWLNMNHHSASHEASVYISC